MCSTAQHSSRCVSAREQSSSRSTARIAVQGIEPRPPSVLAASVRYKNIGHSARGASVFRLSNSSRTTPCCPLYSSAHLAPEKHQRLFGEDVRDREVALVFKRCVHLSCIRKAFAQPALGEPGTATPPLPSSKGRHGQHACGEEVEAERARGSQREGGREGGSGKQNPMKEDQVNNELQRV